MTPDVVPAPLPAPLRAVLPALRCTVCGAELATEHRSLRCAAGHSFDLAKHGYLAMLTGRGVGTGDTAAMVAARVDALAGPAYAPVLAGVAGIAAATITDRDDPLVLDLAGGTAAYLAAVLDRAPAARGLCIDASAPALRRAARAHPRAAALSADTWARLPLADGSVDCALSVFGPRSAGELARVLARRGAAVVAGPAPDHLMELVEPLDLIRVDPRKAERRARTFAGFTVASTATLRHRARLTRDQAGAVVGMGPSAARLDPAVLGARLAMLADEVTVTLAVEVTVYRRPQTAEAEGRPA